MDTSEMDAELQPYRFLRTDYNKQDIILSNDKTTASYSGSDGGGWLAMTRPIGRDHRLILKIQGSKYVYPTYVRLFFTTCDTASLLENGKHLIKKCGEGVCTGRRVTDQKKIREGFQVTIRRTTDNRIEAVVCDPSESSSTELWDMDVTTDVAVMPVLYVYRKCSIQILPDEQRRTGGSII